MSADNHTRLLTATELAELPKLHYLVEGMLRADALNVVYGPSGAGKTMLAIDYGLCVGTGLPWNGQSVERGPVVYVAAEGVSGFHPRLDSWQRSRGVKTLTNFRVWPAAVNLYRQELSEFTAAVDELEHKPSLIVIDTVARCMVGGDENSARDMGLVIASVDSLRARYRCAVLLVHHTGKNGETERGSSALRGAADIVISLKPDAASLKLRSEKNKDGAPFEPWSLHLEEVGESVSLRLGTASGRLSPQEEQILETVSASFGTEWVSATRVIEVSEVPKSSAYRSLESLCGAGLMEVEPIGGHRKHYRLTLDGIAAVPTRPRESRGTTPDRLVPHPSLEGGTETGSGANRAGERFVG